MAICEHNTSQERTQALLLLLMGDWTEGLGQVSFIILVITEPPD